MKAKKKKKSKLKRALIFFGLLVLLGIIVLGFLVFRGFKEAPQVQEKVTSFLQHVSDSNLEEAYSLTSDGFRDSTSMEDFTKAMTMPLFKAQYSNFQEQKQTGFKVRAIAGRGAFYEYSGEIVYKDGDKGEISATLIKEGEEYKIQHIRVNVGIERLEKFQ